MDPIEQFRAERAAAVDDYGRDGDFQTLSNQWREVTMAKRYVYNFDWLGRPIINIRRISWRCRNSSGRHVPIW